MRALTEYALLTALFLGIAYFTGMSAAGMIGCAGLYIALQVKEAGK